MLGVLTELMTVEHLDSALNKIAQSMVELFSLRALVIGVLDKNDRVFRVRVTFGYDKEHEKKIKEFVYTPERLELDILKKYKIAEDVYFIRPEPHEFIKGEEAFYRDMKRITVSRTDQNVWHELDYMKFIFNDRFGQPIGFLEVNEVAGDRVPDKETTNAMRVFSQLASVAVENADMFQEQTEAAQRSKFLSEIIAHDINNYNQAVTSYIQMAIESKETPDSISRYLERASASAWGISELIQRANKLVKIEEEGALNLGPVELGEVLRESTADVLRNRPDKPVKFELKLPAARCFVSGNELIEEIFSNILRNAVDYDPHDKIVIDISVGEFMIEPRKYWCVSIADNGIGIPDSKKNVVFGRLGAGQEHPPASGLGLSIVRAIVEAYHGLVWVEDRVRGDPSKGSVFRVALPMASS
jgi:signal transduction histidine kinase